MKLSSSLASSTHRALLFGPPKTGKSYLAGKLSSDFDLIWFDLENGVDTLRQLPTTQQDRIELISLPDTRVYPIAIETMLKVIKGAEVSICEEHGKVSCAICKKDSKPFNTLALNSLPSSTVVVVDSLTQLTNSAIANITRNQPDDYKLNYDDWANLGKLMDTFLSQVQQAKFNIVCISHETEVEMEDGKMKVVPTAGTKAFSRNTAKYFDEVIYCEVKNRKHIAASSTTYSGNILTGSRTSSSLENQAEASLVPIFKGVRSNDSSSKVSATPAQQALSSLSKLSSLSQAVKKV